MKKDYFSLEGTTDCAKADIIIKLSKNGSAEILKNRNPNKEKLIFVALDKKNMQKGTTIIKNLI